MPGPSGERPPAITPEQEQVIRAAHHALEARGRGKGGIHTTTEACRVIRDLLDVLGALTGVTSAAGTLPFGDAGEMPRDKERPS